MPCCVQGRDERKPGGQGGREVWGKLTALMEDERYNSRYKRCSLTIKVIIAHDGSSSPGLCISRIGVAGAPYSGQKHPGHLASLKGAVCVDRH